MKLVTIKTYTFPHEMAIDRSKLESAGIKCFVRDELITQVHNFYSQAVGGVKLQVLEQDALEAQEILLDKEESIAGHESGFMCPKCGSYNYDIPGFNAKISLLSTLIFGFPLPIPNRRLHCLECGTYFNPKKRKMND